MRSCTETGSTNRHAQQPLPLPALLLANTPARGARTSHLRRAACRQPAAPAAAKRALVADAHRAPLAEQAAAPTARAILAARE